MSVRGKLRKVMLCAALGMGSIMGTPMRPEEIEELMWAMNQPRIELTVHKKRRKPDEPLKKPRIRKLHPG